jgi:hypothetical protein
VSTQPRFDCPLCPARGVTAGHVLGHSQSEAKAAASRRNAQIGALKGRSRCQACQRFVRTGEDYCQDCQRAGLATP